MSIRRALLILPLLLPSCAERKPMPPASVLSPDQFAGVYVDLLTQGVQNSSSPQDSIAHRRDVDSVLRVHGTTREAVAASADWYNRDLAAWKVISDSITVKLERQQTIRR